MHDIELLKQNAAEYGEQKSTGELVLRGYHVVDPKGHLVLLPPGAELKDGFRYATRADHDAAIEAEGKRAAHERELAAAAVKRQQGEQDARDQELEQLRSTGPIDGGQE